MVLGIMEIHISCKYTHTDRGTGLFSRISGFNFFADPWYNNNALYVIYQQPPFSKSGGHGNSHEGQRTPNGGRVGYADALARECNNPWAAAYVHEIMQEDPDILSKAFEAKPADLTWYRCTTKRRGLLIVASCWSCLSPKFSARQALH